VLGIEWARVKLNMRDTLVLAIVLLGVMVGVRRSAASVVTKLKLLEKVLTL
jgi:hypothetical protein